MAVLLTPFLLWISVIKRIWCSILFFFQVIPLLPMATIMEYLPAPLGQFSGLGLLWTSLSGAYVIKGLYQAVAGSGTSRDFDGQKGILRFKKQ